MSGGGGGLITPTTRTRYPDGNGSRSCDRGGGASHFGGHFGTDLGPHNTSRKIQADFHLCFHGVVRKLSPSSSRESSGMASSIGEKGFVTKARGRECHGSQMTEGDGASDPDTVF
eukprot:CAMPEP_0197467860 /NCGR_PEP_ID=MMETSP1175-20131217/65786_1 /TAXON_ID=1003142 /ORGANISM="Triceratium dubium, Strain CCMP147" /LENGTH=114 /DNA_ID=CAMNT_0043003949 /DNA_START=1136 /DNA_END=1480 /DNA_ORIENTATION=-